MKRRQCVLALLVASWMTSVVGAAEPAISLTIAYDNYAFDKQLNAHWGFACLVRGTEKTVLFDTGAKGPVLLANMAKLNINPSVVELLVLSHNHGDHTGGFMSLLEKHGQVKAYLPHSCPDQFVAQARGHGTQVVVVRKPAEICRGVSIVGPIGDAIVEQSLAVTTPQGAVLITGCSHPGVVELVETAKRQLKQDIFMVCGGMHLLKHTDDQVKQIIARLKALGVRRVVATHCTGDKAIALFKEAFGDDYVAGGVGKRLEF